MGHSQYVAHDSADLMHVPFVSIVIPVLDDAGALDGLLATLDARADVEIVVVHAGHADRPVLGALTNARGDVHWLSSPQGRGRQMNAGALSARGRWLVFLHADTRLPREWLYELRRADDDSAVVGGSFRLQLDSNAWQARLIERGARLRVRWFGLAYGDQALFVRRDAFRAIGGYREWPLMEDVDLIRRLRRVGRLHHSTLPAVTSARRWERDGWWRRSGENLVLQLLFFAGASPAWLARRYSRVPGSPVIREAVVVMARAPSGTHGKTRLTRGVPGDPAELRRAILLDTLDAVRKVQRADLFVAFEPADAAFEIRALIGGAAQLFPQQGDTLGDRMRNAFADLFARGYTSVVIVGSDLPTLPAAYVAQALTRLRDSTNAVVIGPATDGGYYLIGLRALSPGLFESTAWGTPGVLSTTIKAAERAGLIVSLMPEWYDVDDVDDLRRALREPVSTAHTRSWAAEHPDFVSRAEPMRADESRPNRT